MKNPTDPERAKLLAILKEDRYALDYPGDTCEGFEVVNREFLDRGRWSTFYGIIAKAPSGKHYRWTISNGSTEYQDDDEFDGVIEVVEPHAKTVTEWRVVA